MKLIGRLVPIESKWVASLKVRVKSKLTHHYFNAIRPAPAQPSNIPPNEQLATWSRPDLSQEATQILHLVSWTAPLRPPPHLQWPLTLWCTPHPLTAESAASGRAQLKGLSLCKHCAANTDFITCSHLISVEASSTVSRHTSGCWHNDP